MVFKTGTASRSFKIMSSLSFRVIFFNWHYLFRLKWLVSFPKGFMIWYIFNVQIAIIFSFYISRKCDTVVSLFYMNSSIYSLQLFRDLLLISFETALFIKRNMIFSPEFLFTRCMLVQQLLTYTSEITEHIVGAINICVTKFW